MGRRNLQGGNKAKAMARSSGFQDRQLRKAEGPEEEYAIVTAVSGNGRFRLTSENQKDYIGILPGSMRGSKKRNNYVAQKSIVLVNNRSSWQTQKALSQVDIVHVYSSNHINELRLDSKFGGILDMFQNNSEIANNDTIVFQNNVTEEDLIPAQRVPERDISDASDNSDADNTAGNTSNDIDIDLI